MEKSKLIELLNNAYGRTQKTPDGLYCRMGRIDRAYNLMVSANGDRPKYQKAINDMQVDTISVFDKADRELINYVRICKREGKDVDVNAPDCDCPYCQQQPTFGGNRL